jgi:DNA-binding protein HU-beta
MKSSKSRMTQAQVIAHMSEKFNFKRSQTKELFDHLADMASTEVRESGEFQLPGFGKLVLSERKARQGRNPATGETIEIPARTALKFRLGKDMKSVALAGDSITSSDNMGASTRALGGDRPTPPDYESAPD